MKKWFGLLAVAWMAGCGDDAANSTESCTANSDCDEGFVCLMTGDNGGCAPICTGNVDACGADARCGGVGVMSVDVCQPKAEASSSEDPPDAKEQPRIPCASDDECKALDPGAICAEFKGSRDCTLPCTSESQCDLPTIGGVTMDFFTCIADEGKTSRKACLPDERCWNNPMACITFDQGGDFEGF